MKVLVTGTSGLVGGGIARHLVDLGWEVNGLSRKPSSVEGLTHDVRADLTLKTSAQLVSGAMPKCSAIIHCAASLDLNLYNPEVVLTNCLGTQQMLQLAQMWSCSNFVYLSSVPVIGAPKYLPITEGHPTNPRTAYHAAKFFGEQITGLAAADGVNATILRLTSPVGVGMPPNRIVPIFIKRALQNEPIQLVGRGSRRQNYVDVRDIGQAVEKCLDGDARGTFNIAGEKSISNYDLAAVCVRLLNSSSKISFSGQPDAEEGQTWEVSIEKAAKSFGYKPCFSIEDSICAIGAEYASGTH